MCGLAGFIGFKNGVELAQKANKIQQHRGPDNQSVWHDDFIALAHQRLSIIDLSDAANQPFIKHNLVLIFNGEIYNYQELQQKLSAEKGVRFTTASDTEVVLEMYLHYGAKSLSEMVGMFAFALYDIDKRTLFIARDHFGIKPLFYTKIGNGFAFSSELKTLVHIPGFDKTINRKSLVSCINYLWVSGNETMFNGCYKLPAAHYATYTEAEGLTIIKYWELDDKLNGLAANEEGYVDDVATTVQASVKRHMVADVPVSSFLSGGLDSSLIAALAKGENENLSTYTISTQDQDKKIERMPDDEKYANIVAKNFNLDHHTIQISPDILKEFPAMVRTLDEPIGDPAAINTYLICKAAREKGVKVLLSGMGADEIYFGYRRQKATLMAVKYNKLPAFVKQLTASAAGKMPVKVFGKGFKFGRWAKRFLSFATLPVDEAYMRSYSYYDTAELKELFKEGYTPAIEAVRTEHQKLFKGKYKNDLVNQICNVDMHMFMLGLNLTYTDRASMAASVEVRVPFIDRLVIERAMRVPGRLKIKKGVPKYILKKAAEKYLPQEIIYRPKAAFGAPIRSWISKDLRPMVDSLLSKESVEKRGFFNYAFVKKLIDADRSGQEDYAYQIYQLLTLELWCREYLDKH
jgi:asparagine synthase (glutamine-hydrolysing)